MTPYAYLRPNGTRVIYEFPFGEAPHTHKGAKRIFGETAWHYPYGGRESFHGPTLRERYEDQARVCGADGVGLEPVGYKHF